MILRVVARKRGRHGAQHVVIYRNSALDYELPGTLGVTNKENSLAELTLFLRPFRQQPLDLSDVAYKRSKNLNAFETSHVLP